MFGFAEKKLRRDAPSAPVVLLRSAFKSRGDDMQAQDASLLEKIFRMRANTLAEQGQCNAAGSRKRSFDEVEHERAVSFEKHRRTYLPSRVFFVEHFKGFQEVGQC